jgi:hypothetical protein
VHYIGIGSGINIQPLVLQPGQNNGVIPVAVRLDMVPQSRQRTGAYRKHYKCFYRWLSKLDNTSHLDKRVKKKYKGRMYPVLHLSTN